MRHDRESSRLTLTREVARLCATGVFTRARKKKESSPRPFASAADETEDHLALRYHGLNLGLPAIYGLYRRNPKCLRTGIYESLQDFLVRVLRSSFACRSFAMNLMHSLRALTRALLHWFKQGPNGTAQTRFCLARAPGVAGAMDASDDEGGDRAVVAGADRTAALKREAITVFTSYAKMLCKESCALFESKPSGGDLEGLAAADGSGVGLIGRLTAANQSVQEFLSAARAGPEWPCEARPIREPRGK